MAYRKKVSLTVKQKLEILDLLKENSFTQLQVANMYGVVRSAVANIKAKENSIRALALENRNLKRKRQRKSSQEAVEQAVIDWFKQMRAVNATVSGPLMLEKATQLALQLGVDFTPTHSWMERLKAREGIAFRRQHGVNSAAASSNWVNAVLPGLLEQYNVDDQFNLDETGLLYRAAPLGALAYKDGNLSGGNKTAKERLTLAFITNASGSDKRVFVIGNSAHPRCVKNMPLPYFANSNSWMTTDIFTKVCGAFDADMRRENRRVVLILDNVTCHNIDMPLTNVTLVFLPPNTAASVQPLDKGIIRAFKCNYRTALMRYILSVMEATGQDALEVARGVDVLRALQWIKTAWSQVTPSTIQNCFSKAGFITNSASEGELLHVELLEVQLLEVESTDNGLPQPSCEDIAVDEDLECYAEMTDTGICDNEASEDNLIDSSTGQERQVSKEEVLRALNTVRSYLQQNCTHYDSFFQVERTIQESILCRQFENKPAD